MGDKLSRYLEKIKLQNHTDDPIVIKFMTICNRLFDQLIHHRKLPLSRFETTNLEQEMTRIIHCYKLCRFHRYKSRDDVSILYERVETILGSFELYTVERQKRCLEWLQVINWLINQTSV